MTDQSQIDITKIAKLRAEGKIDAETYEYLTSAATMTSATTQSPLGLRTVKDSQGNAKKVAHSGTSTGKGGDVGTGSGNSNSLADMGMSAGQNPVLGQMKRSAVGPAAMPKTKVAKVDVSKLGGADQQESLEKKAIEIGNVDPTPPPG